MNFTDTMMPWDVPFFAQHQKEDMFAITDEQLRPYFALPNVLNGLFSVQDAAIQSLTLLSLVPLECHLHSWT